MAAFSDRVRVAAKAAVGIFSENSMKQAWGMLAGIIPGGVGYPPQRGTVDYLRAYSQMPWLRAVASRVSTATARAEWQLYVVRSKGGKARMVKHVAGAEMQERRKLLQDLTKKEELEQVTDHPMLDVLRNANSFQTGYAMRKVTQLHMDLVGDAFWLKERDGQGTVIAVWPVPPHWIVNTPTPVFPFYRVNFRAWRGNIPDTEFVWFSDPDPMNPYGRGSGTAMALGDELDTDEYAARHTKAFFYNSARPDLVVWPEDGQLRDENIKRVEEDWMQQNQGFFRAFKPYFMSRKVGIKELEQNFRSLTLVQLREFERNVIMQKYGVPPEILGVLENSNRSTIDAADYFMSRYVVEPRLEFQRTVLQERLVPEYDERLILEYVSPVQEDKEQFLKAATVAPWAATVDEWRKMQGLAPMEDKEAGELHAVPSGTSFKPIEETEDPVPMPGMPGAPAPKPGKPAGTREGDEPRDTEPGQGRRGIDLLGFDSWKSEARADGATAEEAGDTELATTISKLLHEPDNLPEPSAEAARHEPALARKLVSCWRDHAARVDAIALASDVATGDENAIVARLAPASLAAAQTAALVPVLERVGMRGVEVGAMALRQHGVPIKGDKDVVVTPTVRPVDMRAVNPLVTRWAEQHAAELVQSDAATREIVRNMVASANEIGVPPRELAKALLDVVGLNDRQVAAVQRFAARLQVEHVPQSTIDRRVSRYAQAQQRARALTIARTETIAAVNAGQQLLWEDAATRGLLDDARMERIWIVTEDDMLDTKVCEPLSDARAPLDMPFRGGIMQPPAHPNCRCAIGLVERRARRAQEEPTTAVQRLRRFVYDGLGRIERIEEKE